MAEGGAEREEVIEALQGLQIQVGEEGALSPRKEEEDLTSDDEWGEATIGTKKVDKLESDRRDFPPPSLIQIPSLGDSLVEGRQVTCVAGGILNPSEFYLGFASGSPETMDHFIERMSDSFKNRFHPERTEDWAPIPDIQLIPGGSIVACFNTTGRAREARELVRAKVIRRMRTSGPEDAPDVFKVFLIDLGEYAEVSLSDMFYLHRNFTLEPSFAIKCRLSLAPHYNQFHEGDELWSSRMVAFMTEVLGDCGRRLDIRFVRPLVQVGWDNEEEVIWEVSILKIDPPRRDISEAAPVEVQLIERDHGYYVHANDPKGDMVTDVRLYSAMDGMDAMEWGL